MSRKLAIYLKSAAVKKKKNLIQQINGELFYAVTSKRTLLIFKQCVLIFKNAQMPCVKIFGWQKKYLSKKISKLL